MPLSDKSCQAAKPGEKIKKLSDGGGLQLWIMPNGSKLWRIAYRFGDSQKTLSLGPYPLVTLSAARTQRDDAKRLLLSGQDPSQAKKIAKAEASSSQDTFQNMAEEYLSQKRAGKRAAATLTKLEWLISLASKELGTRKISEIRAPEVLNMLRKVEARGRHETAARLRSTVSAIFRYAIASGRAENDPAGPLIGVLASPPRKHRSAITEGRAFGALIRTIDGFQGQPTTRAALQLLALLFPRPGELRHARWAEFDFEKSVWTIPAHRTKMRREHHVPLSRQSIEVLLELRSLTGDCELLFPSIRSSRLPISENTLNAALRRLSFGPDEMTAHGFRASASTLLNQSGRWHPDAIERQLAHVEGNAARRAYARGNHWDERTRMMQFWADEIDLLKSPGRTLSLVRTR